MKKQSDNTREDKLKTGQVRLQMSTGPDIEFAVLHNMEDIPGLSFEDAVINWAMRTDVLAADSLCAYIQSKSHITGHICVPIPTTKN